MLFKRTLTCLLLTCWSTWLQAQSSFELERAAYANKLHGFWLGQSIANWTGLVTEMDRVEPPFYTEEDWGGLDEPAIWGKYVAHTSRRDFYLLEPGRVWGSDDDTDIEYLYLHLLSNAPDPLLSAEEIRLGWLKHIYSNEDAPLSATDFQRENYLWVSNETAYYLMKDKGLAPPQTSEPDNNPDASMIDAQLTTEIFGLLAPGRPQVALQLAELPIRTTAQGEAAAIARFYVFLHSLAARIDDAGDIGAQLREYAKEAREVLPAGGYARHMFDFVSAAYAANPEPANWEATRDAVYRAYQLEGRGGYHYDRPFDAGINFAASLVSLYYGDGDYRRTVRIATLAGWDSDNPAATWGGLLGFIYGPEALQETFDNQPLSEAYWIHRTRRAFPDHTPTEPGEDRFSLMGRRGVDVIDRVVEQYMQGVVDRSLDQWVIPERP